VDNLHRLLRSFRFPQLQQPFKRKAKFSLFFLTLSFSIVQLLSLSSPDLVTYACLAQSDPKLSEPFKHKFLSKHFVFYSVTDGNWSKQYADFLEDFLVCLDRHFVRIPADWHLTIYLYPDAQTLNLDGCAMRPKEEIMGRYLKGENEVYTYDTCGIGIMAHELMHKVVHENFKEVEPWASEGIPTFFENIYGFKTASGSVFYMGYQNPGRIKELGSGLSQLTIQKIVDPATAVDPSQESDKRLLATFLFYEGKFVDYIKLASAGKHDGYKTIFEAAFKQKMPLLEPRFKKFTKAIEANRKNISHLPSSCYFQSQADFDRFQNDNRDAFQAGPLPAQAIMKFEQVAARSK